MPIFIRDIRDMEMRRLRISLAKLICEHSHTSSDLITLVFRKHVGFAYLLKSIKAGFSIQLAKNLVDIED
jgi:hypothetical protein